MSIQKLDRTDGTDGGVREARPSWKSTRVEILDAGDAMQVMV